MKQKEYQISDGRFRALLKLALDDANVGALAELQKEINPLTNEAEQDSADEESDGLDEEDSIKLVIKNGGGSTDNTDDDDALDNDDDSLGLDNVPSTINEVSNRVTEKLLAYIRQKHNGLADFQDALIGKSLIIATPFAIPYIQEYRDIADVSISLYDDGDFVRIEDSSEKKMGIALKREQIEKLIEEEVVSDGNDVIVLYTYPYERTKSLLLIAALLSKNAQCSSQD